MGKICVVRWQNLLLIVALLVLLPSVSFAEKSFGGLTFIGNAEGICVEISGECATEDIVFALKTCDPNNVVKEKFKNRMPFTLLVPSGTHYMLLHKNGKALIEDEITILSEKVLEYKLP